MVPAASTSGLSLSSTATAPLRSPTWNTNEPERLWLSSLKTLHATVYVPRCVASIGALSSAPLTSTQIGRAHVRTTVTHAHLVCRLLLDKKKQSEVHAT